MQTRIIKLSISALETASEVLNRGGLVVFPTDTVYGIAAKITIPAAIDRIYAVKGREQTKAIAVLIGDQTQLSEVARDLSESAITLLKYFWPGGLTAVVQKQPHLPASISPNNTVGVRIPNYDFVRELARMVGPLATTSANLSGLDAAIDAEMAYKQLHGKIELIVDGGVCSGGLASTVIDCSNGQFNILRSGAISDEKIQEVLKTIQSHQ